MALKLKDLLNDKRFLVLVAVLWIMLVGAVVRLCPQEWTLIRGNEVQEFDPWYHMRMAKYVFNDGSIPVKDPIAYHPDHPYTLTDPPLMYYATAFVARLTGIDVGTSIIWLAALAGVLMIFAGFYFGKVLHGTTAGLFSAMSMAVIPSLVIKTTAGAEIDDAWGLLFFTLSAALAIRAMQTKKLKDAALAVLSLTILAWVWNGFIYVFPVIGLYVLAKIISNYFNKINNYEDLVWFSGISIASVVASLSFFVLYLGARGAASPHVIFLPGFFIIASIFLGLGIDYYTDRLKGKEKFLFALPVAAYALIAIYSNDLFYPIKLAVSIITGMASEVGFMATVAEEQPTYKMVGGVVPALMYYISNYGFSFVLMLLGILLSVLSIWFEDKKSAEKIFPAMWAVVFFFASWQKIKFHSYIAPAIAIVAGFAVGYIVEMFLLKKSHYEEVVKRHYPKIMLLLSVLFTLPLVLDGVIEGLTLKNSEVRGILVSYSKDAAGNAVRNIGLPSFNDIFTITSNSLISWAIFTVLVAYILIVYFKKQDMAKPLLKKAVVVSLIPALILSFFVVEITQEYGSYKYLPSGLVEKNYNFNYPWRGALNWIKENTTMNEATMTWWDFGHWLAAYSERPTVLDNVNRNVTRNADVARMLTSKNITESIATMNAYKAQYTIVSYDLVGKLSKLCYIGGRISSLGEEERNCLATTVARTSTQQIDNKTQQWIYSLKNEGDIILQVDETGISQPPILKLKNGDVVAFPKIALPLTTGKYKLLELKTKLRSYPGRMIIKANEVTIVPELEDMTVFEDLYFLEGSLFGDYFEKMYDNGLVKVWKLRPEA